MTTFVGREAELTHVRRLLESSRLLTLVGFGGIGKTRLALQVAKDVANEYPDGIWLVQLAPVTDGALVPWTVAAVLGVSEQPGRTIGLSLAERIADGRALLIVDNCEHLLLTCAALSKELLQSCPSLRVLATSRQALGVDGETVFSVPGMVLPDSAAGTDIDALRQVEAIRLFVDRATAVAPDFRLSQANAAAVAESCRQLDGIPLAIELAATRLKLLGPEQLAARLGDRLQLLIGGSRTAPERHQTLRATLDWSYELLSGPERTLIRRLAAFNKGWTLAAAEYVASGDDVASAQVLGLLEQLLDKSLVAIEHRTPQQVRFRFLETIRQYAWERLSDCGEVESVRRRHLAWCLQLAQDVQPPGMHHPWHAHDTLQEQENLRAALLWAIDQGDVEAGLRVAVVLAHIWYMQGHYSEGRARLADLLALSSEMIAPDVHASALTWAGYLAYCQGDLVAAQNQLEHSLAIWRRLGNDERTAVCLHQLANVVRFRGDLDSAKPLFEQASVINHRLGHRMREAMNLALVAQVLFDSGDFARAEELNN
jgi:non-specific serine/threonine protein kinase